MKIAAYCRVSRDDLTNENQIKIIKDYIIRQGWTEEVRFYLEEESTRKTRPVKQALLNELREGKYDLLIFSRLDRFARSMIELVMDIEQLVSQGIRVISIQNGFDFSKQEYNSTNMLMLRIFASFAEFERELMRERTLEGLARVRAQGKHLGRPFKKTPPVNPSVNTEVT